MASRHNIVHALPEKEDVKRMRRKVAAVPLVKKSYTKSGEEYYPVFLPFEARIICPWCLKESAISTYPAHATGPRMCSEAPQKGKDTTAGKSDEYLRPMDEEENSKNREDSKKRKKGKMQKKSKKHADDSSSDSSEDGKPNAIDLVNLLGSIFGKQKDKKKVTETLNSLIAKSKGTASAPSASSASVSSESSASESEIEFDEILSKNSTVSDLLKSDEEPAPQSQHQAKKKAPQKKVLQTKKVPPAKKKAPPAKRTTGNQKKVPPKSKDGSVAKLPPAPVRTITTRAHAKAPPGVRASQVEVVQQPPAPDTEDGKGGENDDDDSKITHLPGGVAAPPADTDPDIVLLNQVRDE
mmetsp:Transcript_66606/g.192926  ORF Transcript_66606/g.192926 Transcript_66606/m.192926 type:complete len:353 (-) Transcript_66606:4-1062(-)